MELNEIKKKLALTEEQKAALEEFVNATRKLKDAGVFVFEDRYDNSIFFVNGNNIESHWIGSDRNETAKEFSDVPNGIYPDDINEKALDFDQLFNNYFLPEEFMLVKFKL